MRRSEYLSWFGWRKPGGKTDTFFLEKENLLEDQKKSEVGFLQKFYKDFGNREAPCKNR